MDRDGGNGRQRDIERVLGLLDPEVVVDATRRTVNPKSYVGKEGMRRLIADKDEVWAEFRTEPDQIVDRGDRVVVVGRCFAKGKESGIEVEQPTAHVVTVRDGRIVRWEMGYTEGHEALEAAGLRE
jgi:ketosteroid isomerase-like protein